MRNFFEDIYDDYFGVEKIKSENNKLRRELEAMGVEADAVNMPRLEIGKNISSMNRPKFSKEERDKRMVSLFTKIDNLYIDDESKKLLKKIIEYMRKYNEKIETQYIPFNLRLITKNSNLEKSVKDILLEGATLFSYVKCNAVEELPLYKLDSAEQITQLYENNGIVVFSDLPSLSSFDEKFQNSFMNFLEEMIQKNINTVMTVIIARDNMEINTAFAKKSLLLDKYFSFEVKEVKPDVQDVLREVTEQLKNSLEINDEFNIKLLDYISNTYPKTDLDFPDYRDRLCQYISFHKEIPKYDEEKSLEEIFAELNELVGLQKVKKVLNDLVDLIELRKKSEGDLNIKNVNLHMVFLGNPGTGKTTVARIVAEVLYNLKYIKQNKLIEVSSKDLVGEYVGQTAPKTMAAIEKALGGVLFIDEAYSLASDARSGNSYNDEAIATLIQAMENYRDSLVVIFAGYTKEMQAFLNSNSGIVSRIGYTLEFEDYKTDELVCIFNGMMKKSGFIVSKEAEEEVRKVVEEYRHTNNFGNARFVRNVYEKSILKHASNTRGIEDKELLKKITKEDISTDALLKY